MHETKMALIDGLTFEDYRIKKNMKDEFSLVSHFPDPALSLLRAPHPQLLEDTSGFVELIGAYAQHGRLRGDQLVIRNPKVAELIGRSSNSLPRLYGEMRLWWERLDCQTRDEIISWAYLLMNAHKRFRP